MLKDEDKEYDSWQAHHAEPSSPSQKLEPARRIRSSLIEAMKRLNEDDVDQMFWDIDLCASRNEKMHNGVLDLRGNAKYDDLLEILRDGLNAIDELLPEDQEREADRYRQCAIRYRRKWWDEKEVRGQKIQLTKKKSTLNNEKAVEKATAAGVKNKFPELSATSRERFQKKLDRIAEELSEQRPLVDDSHKKIHAIREAVASTTSVNATQRRILSNASLEDQDHKRQRLDNVKAFRELSGDMEMDE